MKRVKIMNKKTYSLTALAFGVIFLGSLLAHPAVAMAKPKLIPVEGASYNIRATIADNLKTFIGKKVYITLDSGKVFAGTVKSIGDHLVHLEKLDGKDYFDALIRIKNISAIDSRFRKIQR